MTDTKRNWHWKVPGAKAGRQPGLLYEPGNWGDVLKGTWAIVVSRAMASRLGSGPLGYLDPFAGRPSYPLHESTAARLKWLGDSEFVGAQHKWLARGSLAGTALLVQEAAAEQGVATRIKVFDADSACRDSWRDVDDAEVLEDAVAEDTVRETRADLVLVDPYDLFDRWQALLPAAAEAAARDSTILLYLYNKSPRGGGYARNYKTFRRRLADSVKGQRVLLGRVPSDVFVPRAFHEVVLVAPVELGRAVQADLEGETRRLSSRLASRGAFERLD